MSRLNAKFLGTGLLMGALMLGSGLICVHARLASGFNPPIWAPCGISFATLFFLGLEFWPFIFLADAILLFSLYPLFPAALSAAANITISYFGARYLKQRLSSMTSLERMKDLLLFLGAAILIPLVSATAEVVIHFCLGDLDVSTLFLTWRGWWIGQGLSILVLGGIIAIGVNDHKHWTQLFKKRILESLFLFFGIATICLFIFTPLAKFNHSLFIKPYFLFSLVLWAALRFDLLGATLTSFLITAISIGGGLCGFVAFSTSNIDPSERMIMLQFMLGVITLTGLVVATTVREKSEALDARNEFLDIASHELKTPITSLKLQLQLLQRKLGKQVELSSTEIEQLTFLTKVDRQVNRLVKIVEQLLDVSRAERKLMELECENVSLNDLLVQLSERLSSDIQNAKCTLKLELDGDLKGYWDPFRIEQVLENLLSNAIKYAAGHSIEVIGSSRGNRVELIVKDNGPGIDPVKQHSIFDRFVRASETRHVQGLGLGLFITRRIVEAHGGLIFVDSTLGQGTSFTVILPVKAASNAVMPHERQQRA